MLLGRAVARSGSSLKGCARLRVHLEHHPLIVGAITFFYFVATQLDYARRKEPAETCLCAGSMPADRAQLQKSAYASRAGVLPPASALNLIRTQRSITLGHSAFPARSEPTVDRGPR